jgi:hypothetical protein
MSSDNGKPDSTPHPTSYTAPGDAPEVQEQSAVDGFKQTAIQTMIDVDAVVTDATTAYWDFKQDNGLTYPMLRRNYNTELSAAAFIAPMVLSARPLSVGGIAARVRNSVLFGGFVYSFLNPQETVNTFGNVAEWTHGKSN